MDQLRAAEIQYRMQHKHNDGSWSTLVRDPHDSAQIDPERTWVHREVFRCLTCDETVALVFGADEEPTRQR